MKVYLRVRPLNEDEKRGTSNLCDCCVNVENSTTVDVVDGLLKHTFSFEKVFDEGSDQTDVYDAVASPLVRLLLSGRNCCLLAYGGIRSGKTYSMIGCGGGNGDRSGGGALGGDGATSPAEGEDGDGNGDENNEDDRHSKDVKGGEEYNSNDDENYKHNDVKNSIKCEEEESCVSSLGSAGVSEMARVNRKTVPSESLSKRVVTNPPSSPPPLPPSSVYAGKPYNTPIPSYLSDDREKKIGGEIVTSSNVQIKTQVKTLGKGSCNNDKAGKNARKFNNGANGGHLPKEAGIIPRVLNEIFVSISDNEPKLGKKNTSGDTSDKTTHFSVSCSYVALYFENIVNLLQDCSDYNDEDEKKAATATMTTMLPGTKQRLNQQPLSLRSVPAKEDSETGTVIMNGDIERPCNSVVMAIALVEKGKQFMEFTREKMNIDLSHSNTIFSITLRSYDCTSRFDLVDLEGNESNTRPTSKSLAALENVMHALAERRTRHVPYRGSILTKLLKNQMGGDCITRLLINATPLASALKETLSSFRFGQQAKRVANTAIDRDEEGAWEELTNRAEISEGVDASQSTGGMKLSKTDCTNHEDYKSTTRQSVQPGSDRMHDDLSQAREELATVSSLLHSAARRMEADLASAREELSSPGPFSALARSIEADLRTIERDMHASTRETVSDQPLHLTARQIELDLEAARKELLDVVSGHDNSDEDGSIADSTVRRSKVKRYGREAIGAGREVVSEKDQMMAAMEREISALRKENDALNRVKKSREEELTRAREEIQALTLRATDAEEDLNRFISGSKLANNSKISRGTAKYARVTNSEVSNVVGSHMRFHTPLKRRCLLSADESAMDVDTGANLSATNIRVFLRIRPMSRLEVSRRSRNCFEIHQGLRNFTIDSHLDGEYKFCYDQVFDHRTSQGKVYNETGRQAVSDLISGINCALIVYGLSSSGKTYTLMGSLPDISLKDIEMRESLNDNVPDDETAGIAPRLIGDLFKGMEGCPTTTEFTIKCSYVSVYLEKMHDLLQPQVKKALFVRESPKGIEIEGATEALCYDESDIFSLLQRGRACLSVLASRMNMDNSRSHSIFMIKLEQCDLETGATKRSRLLLAEVAGFQMPIGSRGRTREETKILHRSFSCLGNVIRALTENEPVAPYRDSKLTCVLKDALGGNCKSTMIVTASPSSYTVSETLNTVRLGQRVRRILNTPRINWDIDIEQYKMWLMMAEVQLGELVAFVKAFGDEFLSGSKDTGFDASKMLSGELWKSINAIADREEKVNNPCREAFSLGDLESLKDCGLKWKALSKDLVSRVPSATLADVKSSRDKALSLLSDIRSEIVVLRRQNGLLVGDKRKKLEEFASAKKDINLLTLKIAELEHKLGLSENRSKQAISFLQHLRKLCWNLRKDVNEGRALAIEEVADCISESPDLSGLMDLDSLMMKMGLIDASDVNDENDDLPDVLIQQENSDQGAAQGISARPTLQAIDKDAENKSVDDKKGSNTKKIDAEDENLKGALASPRSNVDSQTEMQLRRDLRKMTNKCVELQMLLNEEKTNVETLNSMNVPSKQKQLAQEMIALRKEKDKMCSNASAALWKIQELQVVNEVLAKKSIESSQHISFLEDGFQRLQETFRTTVLGSLDADSQLRERVAVLETVVDSLTVPQNQSVELDTLSRPVPRMNVPVCGRLESKKPRAFFDERLPTAPSRCLMLFPTLKISDKTPSSRVRRNPKHQRRCRKFTNAPKRPIACAGGLKSARLAIHVPSSLPKFQSSLSSYLTNAN